MCVCVIHITKLICSLVVSRICVGVNQSGSPLYLLQFIIVLDYRRLCQLTYE